MLLCTQCCAWLWLGCRYHALERHGSRLVVGTENGYVIAWDVDSGEQQYRGRIHNGSIEGLQFHAESKRVATCSADCTSMVFELVPAPAASATASASSAGAAKESSATDGKATRLQPEAGLTVVAHVHNSKS